jgi:aspartyl-tRNA synthetase
MFYTPVSQLNSEKLNEKVILWAWINEVSTLSNSLWFLTGQDSTGLIQIVVKNKELISRLKEIRKGDLLEIQGIVKKKRMPEKKKEELVEEKLEIELAEFQLINANSSNKDLPFPFVNIKEDNKYRYRYLDLRNPSSKRMLLVKNQFCYELRKFFHEREFVDIETPILANSSPEGAQCFIVPSNLKGRYYTLPQSAQIFKQLLMISGFDKYYQIAKSFRNEDSRSNRQIEFSQLELEMSFTTSQQIRKLIEEMLKIALKNAFGCQIKTPFPTLTYQEVIKKYGTDKPNLHSNQKNEKELSFMWITD